MKLRLFWVFFGIDGLICIIVVGFFFIGLIDGSVSSFNFGIWITIWAALAVIVAGSLWLKMFGYPVFGTILLLVLAVPGLICGLILFLTIVTNTSWI
ncbi:MAG: osmoprotectant transporter permease [Deltaproteobacteria bacterium]|nr:osmoprotectant transporter permease [Deltaproteobacteria bacterium]